MSFCLFNRQKSRESFERLTRQAGQCPHFVCTLPATRPDRAFADIMLYCDLKCEAPSCDEECTKIADSRLWVFARVPQGVSHRFSSPQPIVIRGDIECKDEQLLKFQNGNKLESRLEGMRLELWPWYSNAPRPPDDYHPGEFREKQIPIVIFPQDVPLKALCLAGFEVRRQGLSGLSRNYPMRMNVHIPKKASEVFVISVDLVGYSLKVKEIEESTGDAGNTADFNTRIRSVIREATGLSGEILESTFIAETGDGAILMYSDIDLAVDFSGRLHNSMREKNLAVAGQLAKWHFRVGIAFGAVVKRSNGDQTFSFGGLAISNAVRFQSGTEAASTMIDQKSFDMLSAARKVGWVEKRIVTKHGEDLRGYVQEAYPVDTPSSTAPRTPILPKDRAALIQRLEGLVPHSRLDRLMFILNMPLEMQPPPSLNHQQRVIMFVQWFLSPSGPGLDSLDEGWL